ncbi:MAG: hypothetical protein D6704_03520 [Nitrospirae bacterium]|nr:MAG: hypothetical protein D6704_03520 [Nitrospirota bacterium]
MGLRGPMAPAEANALQLWRVRLLVKSILLLFLLGLVGSLEAKSVAQVVDHVEIHHPGEGTFSYTIPIYQVGHIRFLSAGVGVEERQATYPPYSLKLVFVEGVRAFLTGVSVSIRDAQGQLILEIPSEQVTGPWVFIDLDPGTYTVTATRRDQVRATKQVTVPAQGTRVVYLHWPKE